MSTPVPAADDMRATAPGLTIEPTPMDDPRWSTPVSIPGEAFSKAARLAGSGSPIYHLVNIAVYGSERNGARRIKPFDALSAFEAALTLVLANGQLAAEAMLQAGIPRAEIDDRITRFTRALHAASDGSMPRCLDASMPSSAMPHASMPSSPNPFFATVASERGGVFSAAPDHRSGAAFSAGSTQQQPDAVTTPARAISSSAADASASASAVSATSQHEAHGGAGE